MAERRRGRAGYGCRAAKGQGHRYAAVELAIEWIIFHSRWALAPIYLGLAAAMVLIVFHFLKEFIEFAAHIGGASTSSVTLGVLELIDLAFLANLVLIVILSGFENFVSRIEAHAHDRPDWMTKVDFGGLKQKLMVSIVAISAIEVLKSFMNIDKIDDRRLAWTAGIHFLFLVSMLVVALSDRLGVGAKAKNGRGVESREGKA